MPKAMVLGFVPTAAAVGAQNLNPFRFGHCNLTRLSVKVDGAPFPAEALCPDFGANPPKIFREYHELMRNVGCFAARRNCLVDPDRFANGLTLFAYDFTPDRCNSLHLHPSKGREITIEFTFAEPLTASVDALVYCIFDEVIVQKRKKGEQHVSHFSIQPV